MNHTVYRNNIHKIGGITGRTLTAEKYLTSQR
eukprot:COSAG02_NODE_51442_length_314_cov_0.716279_2_plen_31_part_01